MAGEPRLIAAVIGASASSAEEDKVARFLGAALVDAGFRVVCGGLGGAMRAVCQGARSSENYQPGDTIGILPSYTASDANEFVDIPISTGLRHGRNVIVAATGDVIFALGGKSGTLSEMALGWTLGKPVICVGGIPGWATDLSGRRLDDRRTDTVHGPLPPHEAVQFAVRSMTQAGA